MSNESTMGIREAGRPSPGGVNSSNQITPELGITVFDQNGATVAQIITYPGSTGGAVTVTQSSYSVTYARPPYTCPIGNQQDHEAWYINVAKFAAFSSSTQLAITSVTFTPPATQALDSGLDVNPSYEHSQLVPYLPLSPQSATWVGYTTPPNFPSPVVNYWFKGTDVAGVELWLQLGLTGTVLTNIKWWWLGSAAPRNVRPGSANLTLFQQEPNAPTAPGGLQYWGAASL